MQHLAHLIVVGEFQRVAAILVLDGNVGAIFQQKTHHVDVTAGHGVMKRRLTTSVQAIYGATCDGNDDLGQDSTVVCVVFPQMSVVQNYVLIALVPLPLIATIP